jgi:lysophospholipase L1-like esterase
LSFARYVAIGDSSTEGLEDPDGRGGYRGWADRFAEHVAQAQAEPLLYANLAVRGRKTRHLLEEQLQPALAMRPDLATVFSGTNDIIRSNFDLDAVMADLAVMQRALRAAGATVLTITMPDLSEIAPFARRVKPRLAAFNEAVKALSAETGVLVLDTAAHPLAVDPRLWHEDRLHANSEGHARIAEGLAHTLGLRGFDDAWTRPLSAAKRPSRASAVVRDVHWATKYLTPWLLRRLMGRSSGDGIQAKRPTLTPVERAG